MMDILGLHAFWICFHGTEKGKLSKWRIWHYSALTLSCNIYTSKTPFSEHFNLKTAPAKGLFLFENNVGAATVQKNVPHPVKQNELGYILKTCYGFPTEPASFIFQHKFVLIKFCLNCTLCFLWFAVSRLFSTDLFEKEMRCRLFFFGLILEGSSIWDVEIKMSLCFGFLWHAAVVYGSFRNCLINVITRIPMEWAPYNPYNYILWDFHSSSQNKKRWHDGVLGFCSCCALSWW